MLKSVGRFIVVPLIIFFGENLKLKKSLNRGADSDEKVTAIALPIFGIV